VFLFLGVGFQISAEVEVEVSRCEVCLKKKIDFDTKRGIITVAR